MVLRQVCQVLQRHHGGEVTRTQEMERALLEKQNQLQKDIDQLRLQLQGIRTHSWKI